MSKPKSFWHTLPGILTALAGLIGSIAGIVTIAISLGWLSTTLKPPAPRGDSEVTWSVVSALTCRETGPLGDRWGISYWDFDSDQCTPYREPVAGADFIFKPVYPNQGENTMFGVGPHHGARFAPLQQGRPPWEVPLSEFTKDMHAVPTRTKYPCLTNNGTLCQFEIIVTNNYVYVSVLLFKKNK